MSGRTVHGSQLAVRGRFWAVGAQFLPGAPEAAASLSVPHEGCPALPPGKGRQTDTKCHQADSSHIIN